MITFSGSPLDRLASRREDAAWLRDQLHSTRTRIVGLREGKTLVRDGRLMYVDHRENAIFLGVANGVATFAVEIDGEVGGGTFEEMRPLAASLPHDEAAIAGTARSLFEWHRRHGFCAACGHETETASAGWKRVCPRCGAEHFPRVDPVVIMLPVSGERCLLGRQAKWPPGRMSALAGFVEPGESIEEACAREMREEASLVATRIHYLASQPWPFPSSLMIGLMAEVEGGEAIADGVELEAVRWFSREEARVILTGDHPQVTAPPPFAIAHHLIAYWADQSPLPRPRRGRGHL